MNERVDIEAALRASLTAHAGHAPAAGGLAEQIITQAELAPPARPRRRRWEWRSWTLPLVAAGSVAAVVAALVGVTQFRHDADHKPPAVPATSINATPHPTAPTSPPTTAPTTSPTTASTASPVSLVHFTVRDLSFVGPDEGWALGTARCLNGSGGSCSAMVHTSDGGNTWRSLKPPPANISGVGCQDPCVQNLRFANDQVGYAYSPTALFLTTDGGSTWTRQSGGADALETLDGNVIRVVHQGAGCPPGCQYSVQTAAIGSTSWHDVSLPGGYPGTSVGVALARTGHDAFLEVFGHPAGGGGDARSTLYTSTNDGASWTRRGEPCTQAGSREVDSSLLSSAADGSVTVLCTPRGGLGPQFTSTSTDGGASFRHGGLDALSSTQVGALGAVSRSVIVVADQAGVLRSSNGGATFAALAAAGGADPVGATWIGFETATVGRAVSKSGTVIWTTRDAGRTWRAYTFH